jgi:hypothetical protein
MRTLRYGAVLVLLALSACSHAGSRSSTIPRATGSQGALARGAAAKTWRAPDFNDTFSIARNKLLKDADLDQYIDSSVNGADRKLAKRLMRLMPPSMRGDFVYVDGKRIISNNASLPKYVKFDAPRGPQVVARDAQSAARAPDAARRPMYTANNACGPAPSHSGPYIRYISKCKYAGAIGIVKIDCNSTGGPYMGAGGDDSGNAYFNVTKGYGRTQQASAEGGLVWLGDQPASDGTGGIEPYVRYNGYPSWRNGSIHYGCGQDLIIAHGLVYGQNQFYTFIGQLPSNFNENAYWAGTVYNFVNVTWMFYPTQGDFQNLTTDTDNAGVPSPCNVCAITRETTIGQNNGEANDGSYFGADSGVEALVGVHWEQVAFGNWLSTCGQHNVCPLGYSTNFNTYFDPSSGIETYVGNGGNNPWEVAQTVGPIASGFGPWETFDGIALPYSPEYDSVRRASGSFTSATPPSCTHDAQGNCVAFSTGGFSQTDVQCTMGTYPVTMEGVTVGQQDFYVLNSANTLRAYSHIIEYDSDCGQEDYWAPSEPRVTFGDPNLP